jgi:hypothetical protein
MKFHSTQYNAMNIITQLPDLYYNEQKKTVTS